MVHQNPRFYLGLLTPPPYLGLSPKKPRIFLRPSLNDPINPQAMIPVRRQRIVKRNHVPIYFVLERKQLILHYFIKSISSSSSSTCLFHISFQPGSLLESCVSIWAKKTFFRTQCPPPLVHLGLFCHFLFYQNPRFYLGLRTPPLFRTKSCKKISFYSFPK